VPHKRPSRSAHAAKTGYYQNRADDIDGLKRLHERGLVRFTRYYTYIYTHNTHTYTHTHTHTHTHSHTHTHTHTQVRFTPQGGDDDAFIIEFAYQSNGWIVSNDNYREFRKQDLPAEQRGIYIHVCMACLVNYTRALT
jgi:hypothetical protein